MIIAVVGPTASGKSEFALELAQILAPAQIISADAMQLYRGMDIGTAKIPVDQRRDIRHHQLDVLEPTQEASVACYQRQARQDWQMIEQVGDQAIVAGGSGLYVNALLNDLRFPGTDPQIRGKWEQELALIGPNELHLELVKQDPAAGNKINPQNTRRVVRALEVIELTGLPFAASYPPPEPIAPTLQFALHWKPQTLAARIEKRANQMITAGLIEETQCLLERGLREGKTASRAIGYAQALAVIAGQMDVVQACESIALATRQLASKQRKWFRRDQTIHWLDGEEHSWGQLIELARAQIVSFIGRSA